MIICNVKESFKETNPEKKIHLTLQFPSILMRKVVFFSSYFDFIQLHCFGSISLL